MKKCPICDVENAEAVSECNCGFSFVANAIGDYSRIRGWVRGAARWDEKVRRWSKVCRFLRSLQPQRVKDMAELLEVNPATLHYYLELAGALEKYPELVKYRTQRVAHDQYHTRKHGKTEKAPADVFGSEVELQKYLKQHWDEIPVLQEWRLEPACFSPWDRIDFLARHKKDRRWLVIELKVTLSSDETVGQILKYMGWVKRERATKDERVEGLIISESSDERIWYALHAVHGAVPIDLMQYCLESDRLRLFRVDVTDPPDSALLSIHLQTLEPNRKRVLIEEIVKQFQRPTMPSHGTDGATSE